MKRNLEGSVVLITGASGGIGAEIANSLKNEGARLVLCGRNEDKLRIVAGDGDVMILPGDLNDMGYIERVSARIEECYGRLDVLINNAGIALTKSFENISVEEFDSVMNVNFRAPFFMCQKLLPVMRRSDAPEIINIGSVVSHKGYPEQTVYTASKHAIYGFTKALANELMNENFRVHAICPGGVLTPMVLQASPQLAGQNMILPEDIADVVVFLIKHRGNAIIDEISIHRPGKAPFA